MKKWIMECLQWSWSERFFRSLTQKRLLLDRKKKKRGKKVSALTGEEEKTFECLSSPVRIDDFSIFDF